MRFAAYAVTLLVFTTPGYAQSSKPAQKPDLVTEAYAGMAETERVAIQNDLIWSGEYNGAADPQLGARAIGAVKAFQKKLGGKETGVLTPKERVELAAAAKKKRDAVGWRVVADSATGTRVGLPGRLLPNSHNVISGSRWASGRGEVSVETFRFAAPGTTLKGVQEQFLKLPNRKASYHVVRPNFFVVAGLQSGVKKFYTRGEFKDGEVRGFTILYDQAMEGIVDPVVVAMSSAFVAFPQPSVAILPPPRKKVEYGTAVFVGSNGEAVTTGSLVEACNVVTLAGYGPADIVAIDKGANLSLLRVYGVNNLSPAALAPETGDMVTVAGVGDPAAQGGASTISLTRARLHPGRQGGQATLDPNPGAGFEGAAAFDTSGRIAGVVDMQQPVLAGPATESARATLIAAEAVKSFLAANRVELATAPRSTLDAQKAAVVRVICSRK